MQPLCYLTLKSYIFLANSASNSVKSSLFESKPPFQTPFCFASSIIFLSSSIFLSNKSKLLASQPFFCFPAVKDGIITKENRKSTGLSTIIQLYSSHICPSIQLVCSAQSEIASFHHVFSAYQIFFITAFLHSLFLPDVLPRYRFHDGSFPRSSSQSGWKSHALPSLAYQLHMS